MKKSKTIPSPFDTTKHFTERTCAAKVAEWINEIVIDKNIPLGKADVETKRRSSGERPDIRITESPRSAQVLCVIEMKTPSWDVFDLGLKDNARKKANQRKAKY